MAARLTPVAEQINFEGQVLDILLALKGRGFLLQDGDVPPQG
jgi:hypothetical protein